MAGRVGLVYRSKICCAEMEEVGCQLDVGMADGSLRSTVKKYESDADKERPTKIGSYVSLGVYI